MKNNVLIAGLMAVTLSSGLQAAVLTFDDVSTTTSYTTIPNGYGGFNWNMNVIYKYHHPGSGYDLGRVSGDYAAWNYEPSSVSVSTGAFDFNGAYFASAWDSTLAIELEGWGAGVKLFSDTITVINTGPTWFGANYLGIDELKITSLGQQFVMDNFTFNNPIGAVPIPAAAFMFAPALLGFLGLRRKAKTTVA